VNPDEEAIEILTSENVSLGGPRLNISLKPPEQQQQEKDQLLTDQHTSGLINNNNNSSRYLTLTGTVKRGKNKGDHRAIGKFLKIFFTFGSLKGHRCTVC
jgi:hypothetical protein